MDETAIADAAGRILRAYDKRTPIGPIIDDFPDATVTDSYRIQQEQVRHWVAGGDLIKGHKVGLASLAMQRQMGVHQPDYGHLLASMFHLEHMPIDAGGYLQPRIEPEIGFILGRALTGPGVTVADAIRAVDYVVPALEIVDSRIRDWKISIVDTIADNASSGMVVLGSTPVDPDGLDLVTASMALRVDGSVASEGTGAACLGHPYRAALWLARKMVDLGTPLRAGDLIMTGALGPMVDLVPGVEVVATIDGLGTVRTSRGGDG